jgi:hypothetical protein
MSAIDRRRLIQASAAVLAATTTGVAQATTARAATAQAAAPTGARPSGPPRLGDPVPLDGRPSPAYDYSRANRLPREMTGYWTKSFDVGGRIRHAKVYISPETPIRSYYTVIAVPDGVDTADFLERSSWIDVANRRDEGLFVLEPGEGGWRDPQEEAAYVEAAMAFYQANTYFSIFGLHYLVGYGGAAPALEAWAVAHPLRVIAQVYLDSPGLGAAYLGSYAGREFDGDTDANYTSVVFPPGFDLVRYDETVLPTWYVRPDARTAGASLAYWKRANDTAGAGTADRTLGTVYEQRRRSDRWMTSYAGPIAKVAVRTRPVGTEQIVDFLTAYTRYENYFAYGNQLFERADLDAMGVQVRTMTVAGATGRRWCSCGRATARPTRSSSTPHSGGRSPTAKASCW